MARPMQGMGDLHDALPGDVVAKRAVGEERAVAVYRGDGK